MGVNYFTLDGHNSIEWGVGLSGTGVFDAPARKGESIYIPGRNGAIWVDGDAWEDIEVIYPCWIAEAGFSQNVDGLRNFLLAHADKYYRLTDTYHPNEYRLARYSGGFEADPGPRNLTGRFDITFDCDPRRFALEDSEYEIGSGATETITNAKPGVIFPKIHYVATDVGVSYLQINGEEVLRARANPLTTTSYDFWYDTQGMYYFDIVDGVEVPIYVPEGVEEINEGVWRKPTKGFLPGDNTVTTYTDSGTLTATVKVNWWTI